MLNKHSWLDTSWPGIPARRALRPDTRCPYCGASVAIDHTDCYGYEESELRRQDCAMCGKTFAYWTTIYFYYRLQKADCLNGAQHDYLRTRTLLPGLSELRCRTCGDTQPLPINNPADHENKT